jgi:hypothetical protein
MPNDFARQKALNHEFSPHPITEGNAEGYPLPQGERELSALT